MTATDDARPNIAERYSNSVVTSHLEVKPTPGDVDLLIAAGWVADSLGTSLYRLRVEFEACDVRGIKPLQPVLACLRERPAHVHVVLTGRDAPQELIDAADTVTHMGAVKHHFDAGVPAQRGIED